MRKKLIKSIVAIIIATILCFGGMGGTNLKSVHAEETVVKASSITGSYIGDSYTGDLVIDMDKPLTVLGIDYYGKVTIKGNNKLTVNGYCFCMDGIEVQAGATLEVNYTGGDPAFVVGSDGDIDVYGTFNVNSTGKGILSSNGTDVNKGKVTVHSGGSLNVVAVADSVVCHNDFIVDGGSADIKMTLSDDSIEPLYGTVTVKSSASFVFKGGSTLQGGFDISVHTFENELGSFKTYVNEDTSYVTHIVIKPGASDHGDPDDGQQGSGEGNDPYGSDTGYSNEWINGYWYNADGSQTYLNTGSWYGDATGWWFADTSGWYPVDQWQKIDGKWYFFTATGYMDYSEYRDGCWLNADGSMADGYTHGTWHTDGTGWWYEDNGWYPVSQYLWIDGVQYYFDASGYMM